MEKVQKPSNFDFTFGSAAGEVAWRSRVFKVISHQNAQ
jgi:hypothetical protein